MRAVDYGCLRTLPQWRHSACLKCIAEGIRGMLERHQPSEVAIEGGFYFKNAKTAMTLGEARGVAIGVCAEWGIPVYEYAPRRVKMALVGVGSAEKKQVMKMVQHMLGIHDPIQLDASDALALAICRIQSSSGVAALTQEPI